MRCVLTLQVSGEPNIGFFGTSPFPLLAPRSHLAPSGVIQLGPCGATSSFVEVANESIDVSIMNAPQSNAAMFKPTV